jgi:hypothetical protein
VTLHSYVVSLLSKSIRAAAASAEGEPVNLPGIDNDSNGDEVVSRTARIVEGTVGDFRCEFS